MKKKIIFCLLAALTCFSTIAQLNKQNQDYVNKQISILSSIKPLIIGDSSKISQVFLMELGKDTISNPTIAFNIAMSRILKDDIYFKEYFKDDLKKYALIIFQDDYKNYLISENLSAFCMKQIKPLLIDQSNEIALCDLQYLSSSDVRYNKKVEIKEKYLKEITKKTMLNESKGASYNLQLVLKYRDKLMLSNEQVDSIVAGAQAIKVLQNQGIITYDKRNAWEYERGYIMRNLKENQVSDFVTIRNSTYALNTANNTWKDLKKYNIAADYDSVQVVKDVYSYNINKEKIKYIYKDQPDKLKEMNDFLYKSSYPKAIKQLNVEKRKNNNQETAEKNNLSF